MKLNRLFLLFLAFSVVIVSCDSNDPEEPIGQYETGILIMNEGAFGVNDGEVYHLNQRLDELTQNVFETVNARPYAGLLEDIVWIDDRLYLVANTGKVEIVDPGTFESIGAVIGDLDLPRSTDIAAGKMFISDYGPFDANFATPDSYVAVINNVLGGTVRSKIPTSRKPEDLQAVGDFILVAGAEESKLEVIDALSEQVTQSIDVLGNPREFVFVNQALWLYSTAADEVYFHQINTSNFSIQNTVTLPVASATGRIALGNGTEAYLITSSGFPDYIDGVDRVDIASGTVDTDWIEGSGFYGIGFDRVNRELYLANANGFQGNGDVSVYSDSGQFIEEFEVGRAPSGFFFY